MHGRPGRKVHPFHIPAWAPSPLLSSRLQVITMTHVCVCMLYKEKEWFSRTPCAVDRQTYVRHCLPCVSFRQLPPLLSSISFITQQATSRVSTHTQFWMSICTNKFTQRSIICFCPIQTVKLSSTYYYSLHEKIKWTALELDLPQYTMHDLITRSVPN